MKRVVTSSQMKYFDHYAIDTVGMPSLVLMERAALSVVQELKKPDFILSKVLIVCGSGNNGADGVAIGRLLHLDGVEVSIFLAGDQGHFSGDLKIQIAIAEKYNVSFVNNLDWSEYTTIVDAIFGVGLSRDILGNYVEIIKQMNQASAKVAAVDIPSGIHGDYGTVMGIAVKADVTVTFAFAKAGLLLYPGACYAGRLAVSDIGITEPPSFYGQPHIHSLDHQMLQQLPVRPADGNKSTFGKVLLIAGTNNMSGAASLSGEACMRCGAGMVKIHTRQENRIIIQSQLPEAVLSTYSEGDDSPDALTAGMNWADVVGIGPGLGTSKEAENMLVHLLTYGDKPLVIDADGLNLLTKHLDLLSKYKNVCILTPHMGEMSRLTGLSVTEIKKNPIEVVQDFAVKYHVICICKDARTVIGDSCGQTYINLSGNEGMGTAGAGDVLTGVILGLLAQQPEADQALCAVYLHGAAGDQAKLHKSSYSVMAHDIIDEIPLLLI